MEQLVTRLNRYRPTIHWLPNLKKENQIVGATQIYLNPDGSQYTDIFKDTEGKEVKACPKLNKGITGSGGVVVQEAVIPKTLWIAAGVESALSIAKAVPHQRVVVSLSVQQIMSTPVPPETQTVVICADRDPSRLNTKESIIKAVDSFLSQGVKVFIALPPPNPSNIERCDFNDLLKGQGITAVQKCLEQRLEIKDVSVLKTNEPKIAKPVYTEFICQLTLNISLQSNAGTAKKVWRPGGGWQRTSDLKGFSNRFDDTCKLTDVIS